jgi:hypothetical protein
LTCELVLAVLMLAAEKSKDTFIAPIGIGLALFVAELAGESALVLPYISLRLLKIQTGHITYHRTHRGLLHWRFAQPNAQLWSSCRINVIPWISLDLLGWAIAGSGHLCGLLPLRKSHEL